ncbi:MAG: hypothetical protein HOE48_17500 [Candidatus Latescibacteria bacterium]|jgi:hypothetical protein|nr:hypothetical protein [Candidatus Latescibacterota bacterium]MBT4139718.1 hypothetical protein [Candidatus Latescibacterota bacterium]
MQTLKDVIKREDERVNLKNGAICISIVVIIVFMAFGLRGMHFAFEQSPATTPVTTVTADGEDTN